MWLHILKKDLKLHWPYVAVVMALKVAATWTILQLGMFSWQPQLGVLHAFIDLAFAGAAGLAIIVVVHSDPVVSNNDDWLIRPIRRSDLALDKLGFAALVTLMPTFVFDLGVGLMHGLDVLPAMGAATYTALVTFIGVGLPALAVGTITASWHQAAGIVFAIVLTWTVGILTINYQTADLDNWPFQLALKAILVFAAALVLGLQYGRRNTATSRGVFAVAAICALAVTFTPRTTGYQIQRVIDDGKVAAAGPIRLSFDDQSKAKVIGKALQYMVPVIYVPLKVVVDPDRIVTINYVDLSIVSGDGKPLYRGAVSLVPRYLRNQVSNVLGDTFDSASNGHKSNYQAVNLPPDVYAKFKDTPGRLSLTYQLSSYAPAGVIKAPLPLGARQKVAGFGVCETRLNPSDDRFVELYCFPATDSSNCISATVLDLAGASIGAPQTRCSTTFKQWGLNTKALTDPGQLVVTLPAANGAGTRPLTLTSYKVASHFTQTVILPQVRLMDLTAAARS
ncbi:hypothetical protein [Caballeronia sp. dw_19]|uniref:hypothetical protein n=1 Tax=Caballeronia sp. dw_19 TaxID=2719791 RepID=UPI001BD43E2E|nr:hypothetical protein [Caballeronia sp. dw_19]